MKLHRRFASALNPLLAHRVRTVLALSGVAVGVAAVIASRAVGDGAQKEMVQTVERMGTNMIIVKPLSVKRLVSRPQISGFETSLRLSDYEEIAALPFVREIAPTVERPLRAKAGSRAMKTTVRGTSPAYLTIRNFQIAVGRCFDLADDAAGRRVAVVGAGVNQELSADGKSLLGEEIRINGVPFDVIGVLAAKGASAGGADQDNQIVVPLQTALRRLFNTTWLTSVYVGVSEPFRMANVETEIRRVLHVRHQKGAEEKPIDFAVQNTTNTRAFQQQMTESLSRYATGLASIALLIGGIGIMAFMLITVRERTGEIGLRVAIGARPLDILLQFLIEAAVLAFAGWACGLAVGAIISIIVATSTSWPIAIPMNAILASLGMSVIIGLGFGSIPARNAARIPPIQALLRT